MANESLFHSRELSAIRKEAYLTKYPEFKSFTFFPVTSYADPGAENYIYKMITPYGMAKWTTHYTDDLPSVDESGEEFVTKIKECGNTYHYSYKDVDRSKLAGYNVVAGKARSSKRAILQEADKVAWLGNTEHNIGGVTQHPNISVMDSPMNGSDDGGVTPNNSRLWEHKTPDQVLDDLNNIVATPFESTLGTEEVDTMIFPLTKWTYIRTKLRSSASDRTILSFFKEANPQIKNFGYTHYLNSVLRRGMADIPANYHATTLAYKRNPDNIHFEIPRPYTQWPEFGTGRKKSTEATLETAGIIIIRPLSVIRFDMG